LHASKAQFRSRREHVYELNPRLKVYFQRSQII
jgi:hypothetical protein